MKVLSVQANCGSRRFAPYNVEFHRTLLSRCPSRWLRGFCDNLADESYRYRQVAAGKVFHKRDEHAEHLAIFKAVIEGRTEDALRALKAHDTRTAEGVSG